MIHILAAQQTTPNGAELLDQALKADPSLTTIMSGASQLAGTGVDMGSAAVIVAVCGLVYRGLQLAAPFLGTLNDIWRAKALPHLHQPPHPPGPPGPPR